MTTRHKLIIACLLAIIAVQLAPALPVWPWSGIGQSSPFGVPEFAVLVVEESAKRGDLPNEQLVILLGDKSGSVRSYCNSKGRFHLFDLSPDGDLSKMEPFWKVGVEAAKAKNLTPPYMVAGSKGHAYVGPLPKDTASALSILTPMGGP